MNINLKFISTLLICLALSACASTTKLDREMVHEQKIKTINLNTMGQNISIQESDSTVTGAVAGGLVGVLIGNVVDGNINAKRKKALEPFIEMLATIDVNKVLKNALLHNVENGRAFGGDVVIATEFDLESKPSLLVPVLTPSVKMLADYSGVAVELAASTAQHADAKKPNRYVSIYTSQQKAASEVLTKREENKQYWKDNSVLLREKIVDGLYDVAKQFADDYNQGEN